ncbi:MAG: hypothetical protein KJ774_08270, partial [Firmicutes bacterium]|nr:hypothetical protein [Bacillota bacterium]
DLVKIHISGNSRNEVEKVLTLLEPALHGERVKIVEKSPFIHAYVTPKGRGDVVNATANKKTN